MTTPPNTLSPPSAAAGPNPLAGQRVVVAADGNRISAGVIDALVAAGAGVVGSDLPGVADAVGTRGWPDGVRSISPTPPP
jgi:hypothetical protein